MKRWQFTTMFLFALGFLVVGCGPGANEAEGRQREVVVFAAASLAEAFTEIADQFEAAHPGTVVILNFAGSQQLSHQLSQGAPADVFASANKHQMDAAIETGRVRDGSQQPFVRNQLAVVYPADNPGRIETLADLARPGLRLIVAAPEVPAGQYTQSFLSAAAQDDAFGASFRDGVLDNIVSYEENVRAVLSKIALGAADGGIVYASDLNGRAADQVGSLAIPKELSKVADYPIAPIINSDEAEIARSFIDFVLSAQGQELLRGFGFLSVNTSQ